MKTLVSLTAFESWLGVDGSAVAAGESARMRAALVQATAGFERLTGRCFLPVDAALPHAAERMQPDRVLLRDDLLALAGVVDGDGQAVPLDQVVRLPGGVLRRTDGPFAPGAAGDPLPLTVSGTWGYGGQWLDTRDALASSATASAAAVYVQDAGGADAWGLVPRFQVGQVLRIEAERLIVTAVDVDSGRVEVLRAQLGTTAASHSAGAALWVYAPDAQAQAAVLAWAGMLYRLPDGAAADADLPEALWTAVRALRRVRV